MKNNKELTTKKILIAEDEKPMAQVLKLKLTQAGFVVKTVGDGEEALNELGKEPYHLLLLDLLMPVVDGWTVLSKVKGKNIKIIVISNLNQQEDIVKAKNLGAIDFWVKSDISLTSVVDKVAEILKG